MDPKYEFLTNQCKQMLSQSMDRLNLGLNRNKRLSFHGKAFDRLGDLMISGGTWLKKTSNSQMNDHSVAFSSRNQ